MDVFIFWTSHARTTVLPRTFPYAFKKQESEILEKAQRWDPQKFFPWTRGSVFYMLSFWEKFQPDRPYRLRDLNRKSFDSVNKLIKSKKTHNMIKILFFPLISYISLSVPLYYPLKIARLCRLFEKQFPNCGIISQQLRQIIFNSTITNDIGTPSTS